MNLRQWTVSICSVPVGKYSASWMGQLLRELVIIFCKVNEFSKSHCSSSEVAVGRIAFSSTINICYQADKGQQSGLNSCSNPCRWTSSRNTYPSWRAWEGEWYFWTGTVVSKSRPLREQNEEFTKLSTSWLGRNIYKSVFFLPIWFQLLNVSYIPWDLICGFHVLKYIESLFERPDRALNC